MTTPVMPVQGPLDGSNVHAFLQRAADMRAGNPSLIIDLSQAQLRSAGIGALVHIHADLHARGGTLYLCGLTPDAEAVLKMLGVIALFSIIATPADVA
jgi:anti-anti-sigma factor